MSNWDAAAADMRRFYRIDLRDAMNTMPLPELSTLVRRLPASSQLGRDEAGDIADWGWMPELLAQLLDVMHAWLRYEWSQWTTDPDDPEVKAERERRKRSGHKPPAEPLIPPYAPRPLSLATKAAEAYRLQVQKHLGGDGEGAHDDLGVTPHQRMVTVDELDAILALAG